MHALAYFVYDLSNRFTPSLTHNGPIEFVVRGVYREELVNQAKAAREEVRLLRRKVSKTAENIFQKLQQLEKNPIHNSDRISITQWWKQCLENTRSQKLGINVLQKDVSSLLEQTHRLNKAVEVLEKCIDVNLRYDAKTSAGWTWWR